MKTEGLGEELAKRVGAAIARHRKAAGYTQARVADSLGLEKETVSRIENGGITPTLFRIAQFADLFGCPVSALFGEYRGKAIEDSAQVAEMLSDLPEDARRGAMRIVSEFATIAREREEGRRRLDELRHRVAELERDVLMRATAEAMPKRKPPKL